MSGDRQLSVEIVGTVLEVRPWEEFSSGVRKRSIVIEVADGRYPQEILVEFAKDRGELLEDAKPGMTAKIGGDIRGRRWDPPGGTPPRWFTSIAGWRIDLDGSDEEEHDPGAYDGGIPDDGVPF